VGRAPLEAMQAATRRARTLGNSRTERPCAIRSAHDSTSASPSHCEVAGARHDAPHERVAPRGRLDDAIGLRQPRQQQDDVDERRMIGDDQPWPLPARRSPSIHETRHSLRHTIHHNQSEKA